MVDLKMPSMPFMKKKGEAERAKEGKRAKEQAGEAPWKEASTPAPEESEIDALRRKVALYRRVIERYRDMIEKAETKTVTELRSLIVPEDPEVVKLRDEILEEFRPYIYQQHFEQVARKAYQYVLGELANEELPVDFWLEPRDMIELRAADEMDKAVLLCSLLRSLECETAKVVVESNGERHVFVGFQVGGRYVLMDPAHKKIVEGEREDVLIKQFGGGRKNVYEFNDKEYDEIVGGQE
ncbi:MAG: hypothetical protein Q7T16_05715 [Candidatus Burarchaeum sp.]|nr:hypothetical protein [Candidatus Burarchaeum sp.]MDO8340123.1 hypothetical protein [Candidatus Burarchaeum sp.]